MLKLLCTTRDVARIEPKLHDVMADGHLNEIGRYRAANELIKVLSEI